MENLSRKINKFIKGVEDPTQLPKHLHLSNVHTTPHGGAKGDLEDIQSEKHEFDDRVPNIQNMKKQEEAKVPVPIKREPKHYEEEKQKDVKGLPDDWQKKYRRWKVDKALSDRIDNFIKKAKNKPFYTTYGIAGGGSLGAIAYENSKRMAREAKARAKKEAKIDAQKDKEMGSHFGSRGHDPGTYLNEGRKRITTP